MNELFSSTGNYLLNSLKASAFQIIVLFGPLLLLATIMHFLSLLNQYLSFKSIGKTIYIYLFAWLGTSFHELGHAFFAILFGHKIKEIKLFKPDPKSGTLGYVKHSFNTKNIYHQAGNFFIGIGPILTCALVLYIISVYLLKVPLLKLDNFDFSTGNFALIEWSKQLSVQVWKYVSVFFESIYTNDQTSWWKLAIFIYCFYSIGSSITLSPSDIKSAALGFFFIISIVIIFNISTLWAGDFASVALSKANKILTGFYVVMFLSALLQLAYVIVFAIFYSIKLVLR